MTDKQDSAVNPQPVSVPEDKTRLAPDINTDTVFQPDSSKPKLENTDATVIKPSAKTPSSDKQTRIQPASSVQNSTRIKPATTGSDTVLIKPEASDSAETQALPKDPKKPAAETTPIPGPGETIRNRFILEKSLGIGGMGEVYLARDLRREEMKDTSSKIAIKFLNPNLAGDKDHHQSLLIALQREAKKAQNLAHPNIVTVYDFDRDADLAFITMEYLQGNSLADILAKNWRMPEQEVFPVIEEAARGLAYAHQKKYVHADIKPANLFVTQNGICKILDFGIAQAVTSGVTDESAIDHADTAAALGALTPLYASLEMLRGLPLHPSDDVYALCVVAYEALTGCKPYVDPEGKSITALVAHESGATLKEIPGISRRHLRALQRGLALKQKDRFRNAGELIDAIKPRNIKKEIAVWSLSVSLVIALIAGTLSWLPDPLPTLEDLDPIFAEQKSNIIDADSLLAQGDLDLAHNLYAQAKDAGANMPGASAAAVAVLQQVLSQRMDTIATSLIQETREAQMDEFRIRQLQLALEYLKADSLGSKDEEIDEALTVLSEKLASYKID